MKRIKEFLYLTFSVVIMACGIYFFKFPNKFSFGGVTGMAILIAQSGIATASTITLVINIFLLLIGFSVLGKAFGEKTIYTSLMLSLVLKLLEQVYPMSKPLTAQPMMELVYAIVLPAIGSGMLFTVGASSGGTDIIAIILKKYTSIDIGRALFASDIVVVLLSFVLFGPSIGLMSTLGLCVKTLIIDKVIESLNKCKYFNVVCENYKIISQYITTELHRSATVCHGKGIYSNHDKYILFTAMKPSEAVKLRGFIREQDPSAFIMISNSSEIIGKGFRDSI